MTPNEVQTMVRSELEAGESLLWTGSADATRAALSSLPAMLFGIPFAGFAIFWMTGALRTTQAASRGSSHAANASPFLVFFGLPFLLIGLAIVFAPLFAYLKAVKTTYAITDKRIIIITDGRTRAVKSCTPADIVSVDHLERAGGTGDVIIRTNGIIQQRNSASQINVSLLGVSNVKEVARLVLNLHSQRA